MQSKRNGCAGQGRPPRGGDAETPELKPKNNLGISLSGPRKKLGPQQTDMALSPSLASWVVLEGWGEKVGGFSKAGIGCRRVRVEQGHSGCWTPAIPASGCSKPGLENWAFQFHELTVVSLAE